MSLRSEDEVRKALAGWSADSSSRRDTTKLTFESIENKGPVQIVLTSTFESRGVTYDLSPAPRSPRRPSFPDPWKHAFEFPDGDQAVVGLKLTHALVDMAIHMGCDLCSHSGKMRCSSCDGDGQRTTADGKSRRCYTCGGTGELTCEMCTGTGALYGKPTIWAAIDSVSINRVLEADDLPNSVFIGLSEAPVDGEVVHRQQGPIIEELRGFAHRGAGAYRQAAEEGAEASAVRTLCKRPGIPDDARLLRQELELRRVDVWEVKSREAKTFWAFGEPLQVLPHKVLRSWRDPIITATVLSVVASAIAWLIWAAG